MSGTKGTRAGRLEHGNTGPCSRALNPSSLPCTTAAHFARHDTPANRFKHLFIMCSGSQGPRGPVLEVGNTGTRDRVPARITRVPGRVRPPHTSPGRIRQPIGSNIYLLCIADVRDQGDPCWKAGTREHGTVFPRTEPEFPALYDRRTLRQA